MYRLREMDIDDKVCEQVSLTMIGHVYPKEVIERCVQHSEPWSSKARRVRQSTMVALVLFLLSMALWSRLNQCQVWRKLVGKRESICILLSLAARSVLRASQDDAKNWAMRA